MGREQQLNDIFSKLSEEQRQLNEPLVEKAIFLEARLEELEKLPFYRVHPNNPALQKRTEAGKLYKELLQSYCNVMKMLNGVIYKSVDEEADEFDEWENGNA